ncbi:aminoglycoside phosphotransferase family protein [Thermosipho ferrireducens]|uniref:Aminoglycoside phosphotransferase family protein n=1 Tax=Thermosipho ferrireducens TaxID=2571116 RepID=A0ABX7S5S3_9BACT|nr:aminoglycoside phosphotransferase family protein [Thermosipho ferrireducens]QTA37917.1 aminoglycoside phosphotransferase family protein [Thermosipho ferrireducens]
MLINEKIVRFVKSLIGNFEVVKNHRSNSNRTGVLEIITNNKRMFVKIHKRLNRWSPEVYAYKNWTCILGDYVPKLVHFFNNENFYGIITTPIRGKTVNESQINDENILKRVYYKAGELLRQLHNNFEGTYYGIPSIDGSPLENDAKTDPVDYINSALENILKLGYDKELFNGSDKELVQWCMKHSYVFANNKPVPTNWDFSQNNWMVDENGRFTGFIDFENMLWGIDVDSFGIIIERYTPDRPRLRKALFEGYGLEKSEEKHLQLKIVSVKIAIADITYGASIGNSRIFSLAKNLMENLKKPEFRLF